MKRRERDGEGINKRKQGLNSHIETCRVRVTLALFPSSLPLSLPPSFSPSLPYLVQQIFQVFIRPDGATPETRWRRGRRWDGTHHKMLQPPSLSPSLPLSLPPSVAGLDGEDEVKIVALGTKEEGADGGVKQARLRFLALKPAEGREGGRGRRGGLGVQMCKCAFSSSVTRRPPPPSSPPSSPPSPSPTESTAIPAPAQTTPAPWPTASLPSSSPTSLVPSLPKTSSHPPAASKAPL